MTQDAELNLFLIVLVVVGIPLVPFVLRYIYNFKMPPRVNGWRADLGVLAFRTVVCACVFVLIIFFVVWRTTSVPPVDHDYTEYATHPCKAISLSGDPKTLFFAAKVIGPSKEVAVPGYQAFTVRGAVGDRVVLVADSQAAEARRDTGVAVYMQGSVYKVGESSNVCFLQVAKFARA